MESVGKTVDADYAEMRRGQCIDHTETVERMCGRKKNAEYENTLQEKASRIYRKLNVECR